MIGAALTLVASAQVTWNFQDVTSGLHVWTTGSVNLSGLTGGSPYSLTKETIAGNAIQGLHPNISTGALVSGASWEDIPVRVSLNEDVWQHNGTSDNSFGTLRFNNSVYVYFDAGEEVAGYTPTVDYIVAGKTVSDFFSTGLDDMAAHEIVDLGNGRGKVFVKQIAAVPEPSSTALLGLGALGFVIRRKR